MIILVLVHAQTVIWKVLIVNSKRMYQLWSLSNAKKNHNHLFWSRYLILFLFIFLIDHQSGFGLIQFNQLKKLPRYVLNKKSIKIVPLDHDNENEFNVIWIYWSWKMILNMMKLILMSTVLVCAHCRTSIWFDLTKKVDFINKRELIQPWNRNSKQSLRKKSRKEEID